MPKEGVDDAGAREHCILHTQAASPEHDFLGGEIVRPDVGNASQAPLLDVGRITVNAALISDSDFQNIKMFVGNPL